MYSSRTLASFSFLILMAGGLAYGAASPPRVDERADCRSDETVDLNIDSFIAAPEDNLGKCVHWRGVIADRFFFKDVADVYRPNVRRPIAIYGDLALWKIRRAAVDVVAYTYSCAELSRRATYEADQDNAARAPSDPVSIVLIPGECHYSGLDPRRVSLQRRARATHI
jgi:hypothetical protein